jgi:hypothetical protein
MSFSVFLLPHFGHFRFPFSIWLTDNFSKNFFLHAVHLNSYTGMRNFPPHIEKIAAVARMEKPLACAVLRNAGS